MQFDAMYSIVYSISLNVDDGVVSAAVADAPIGHLFCNSHSVDTYCVCVYLCHFFLSLYVSANPSAYLSTYFNSFDMVAQQHFLFQVFCMLDRLYSMIVVGIAECENESENSKSKFVCKHYSLFRSDRV